MPSPRTNEHSGATNGNGKGADGHEAYEAWKSFYRQMTSDGMEFFQRGVETAQKMNPCYPGQDVFNVWMDSFQDFVGMMGKESPALMSDPYAYRKMYEVWLETWTKQLERFMGTPEFAAKSGRDIEMLADAQKRLGQVMETYWETLRLPSTADMREIYHKLYHIERKLDDIDFRMRDLAKSAGGRKKAEE